MPTPSRHPLPGIACVLATLASWSAVPLFIFYFAGRIDAWTSNGWRYAIAALFWLPVLLWSMRRGSLARGFWKAVLVPATLNTFAQVCFTLAHYEISPGLVTFGLRIQIVCVAIGAALLFPSERLVVRRPAFILGLCMVLGGTLATIVQDPGFGTSGNTLGVVLALSAGSLFACYGLAVRKFLHHHPAIASFAAISQISAGVMLALMLLLGRSSGSSVFALSASDLLLLILSAIIGIALGHVLFYIAMARLGVAAANGVIQLQPFGAAIGAMILFNEPMTPGQWLGGVLAVAGAIVILLVQAKVNRLVRARPSRPSAPHADRDDPSAVRSAPGSASL